MAEGLVNKYLKFQQVLVLKDALQPIFCNQCFMNFVLFMSDCKLIVSMTHAIYHRYHGDKKDG